ncbi:hypothetical protein OFB83_29820, partial [Escherichia coli]|nr:hypothetical protein [Escherichia coli]
MFANQPAEHACRIGNGGIEVYYLRLHYLPSAEGEQLPCQFSGAFAGFTYFFDVDSERIALRQFAEQEVAVAVYRRQHVVEIMCDAAGQQPD